MATSPALTSFASAAYGVDGLGGSLTGAAAPLVTLAQQIRSQWGSRGDWNQGGIDRAMELARLFHANGITDLSDLSTWKIGDVTRQVERQVQTGTGVGESATYAPQMVDAPFKQLMIGGKPMGFLGDVNRDNSLSKIGGIDGKQDYLEDMGLGQLLGWSSTGKGNVSYIVDTDPATGRPFVRPQWASSSDAGDARDIAKGIASVLLAGYGASAMGAEGAAGGAAAGAGGAPLNMAMIESGLGTAGYGFNAGAAASGLFNPATIGAGAGLGFDAIAGAGAAPAGAAGTATLGSIPAVPGSVAGISATGTLSPALTAGQIGGAAAGSSVVPSLAGAGGGFMGLSAADILAGAKKLAPLALAGAASKNVPAAQADPALAAAIAGQTGVAQSAEARAAAGDAYWRENFAPRLLSQMDQQILLGKELQDFNLGLARKYDRRYWDTTARFQDQFYDDVDRFNSEDTRRELAGKAMGDVRQGFSAARAIAARDLTRRGVNPGDGKFAGLIGRMATDEALASASAANTTRQQARERGLQLKATAAGLGGNLTSASAGYGGAAGAASQIGMSGVLGAQTGFNANESNYRGALGLASGAYGALGGIGSGLTQLNFQSGRDNAMGWNKLIGMGLGMIPWGK